MSRALRVLLGAASLAVLASCSTGPLRFAACRFEAPEPRTTQGLEYVASDRGIGGSGISTGDRGLGGSGMRAGIIGVVTGFASLCVNGYEVELDEASVVTIEGHPATAADIHLGQLVVIEAEEDDGGGDVSKVRTSSGHGILGIRERLAGLGGALSIANAPRGLRILAIVPVGTEAHA